MSTNEQKRQKKLAKKRSKELAKRKHLAAEKQSLQSLAGQVRAAAKGTIDRCLVSDGLLNPDVRFGEVLFSRYLPDGRVVMAIILLDRTCLGVKDAFARVYFPSQVAEIIDSLHQKQGVRKVAPEYARKLVEDNIEWSRSFGLQPHADYAKISGIWDDVDAGECRTEFEFGKDGQPTYIPGHNDSESMQRSVRETLASHRVSATPGPSSLVRRDPPQNTERSSIAATHLTESGA